MAERVHVNIALPCGCETVTVTDSVREAESLAAKCRAIAAPGVRVGVFSRGVGRMCTTHALLVSIDRDPR